MTPQIAAEHGGDLSNAFKGATARFCVVSFTSDWLFPPEGNREIVTALNHVAANVSYVEIESEKGHDAFLLDEPEFCGTMSGFLSSVARQIALTLESERLEQDREGFRDLFLSMLGHDLRNPLNAIAVGAQALALEDDLDASMRCSVP